jgi:hypothetical protein
MKSHLMDRQWFQGKKKISLIGIGVVLLLIIIGIIQYGPEKRSALPDAFRTQLEAARKEGYDRGLKDGYKTAKEETAESYKRGYATAQKEVRWQAGITGFLLGLLASVGGFAAVNRKVLTERIRAWRKKYELQKTFDTIPPNLPPDVSLIAEQIARAYNNVTEQFRVSKGYTVATYIEHWRPKLKALMGKAVQLMDLIQELETARANVDQPTLERTITDLRQTVQHAKDDEARHTALKSLKQAKQTQQDLQKTSKNIEHCKTALQGITGVLESVQLKISNIKVNTQKTELLDELSSDLETEMSALEEALKELSS